MHSFMVWETEGPARGPACPVMQELKNLEDLESMYAPTILPRMQHRQRKTSVCPELAWSQSAHRTITGCVELQKG